MWIKRDFLSNFVPDKCLEAVLLRGARQIGKSTMLLKLAPPPKSELYLDDPTLQAQSQNDPEFVLAHSPLPILIDEVQRAPNLLFSIKKQIDSQRRERLRTNQPTWPAGYRITGSNQQQLDEALQETLSGRMSIFYVHGLSINELINLDPKIDLNSILFRGGFPELWVRQELNPISFHNDYIATFIERDIARTAGVEKISEFRTVVRLAAARVGELLNFESLGRDAGVSGKTAKEWLSLLEYNRILYFLRPYHSNFNKRLIKMPKVYFLDTGICVRLQSHQGPAAILHTPQAGHLFENLIISEVVKTKDHFQKDWELFFWRTKEAEEIDLIVETPTQMLFLEIKLGAFINRPLEIPKSLKAECKPHQKLYRAIIVAAGEPRKLAPDCDVVPYTQLAPYLLESTKSQ